MADITDEKYIVFKVSEFYELMGELALPPGSDAPPDMDCAPIAQKIQERAEATKLDDAVVIRRQDVFAPPALDSYSNSIQTAIQVLKSDPHGYNTKMVDHLEAIAGYFREQAAVAWDTNRKVPD